MKAIAWSLAFAWVWAASISAATRNDGSLEAVADALSSQPSATPCPLSISARAVLRPDGQYLSFTLTNNSGHTLTLLKQNLPWGNAYSIRFAALTADGTPVPGGFPIDDDFGHATVAVAPGQTLRGDYDLAQRWNAKSIPPTGLPRDKLIVLIWTYTVIANELSRTAPPVCSGVVAFKTPK